MQTHILFSILVLGFSLSEAKDFVSAPDRGIIISVKPDKVNTKGAENVKFSGSIKALNKEKSNNGNGNGNNGKSNKESLLEEFQKEGFSIVGTFPSDAVDITNNLELTSSTENEIKFSFTASNVVAGDLNQFSVKVYSNQKNKGLLARLAQIKSKIERRILALQALKNQSKSENWSAAAIEFISKKSAQLSLVSQQISVNMNANENLLAENTYAMQVDNYVASPSQISTLMNKYRFVISAEIGTLAEGLSAKIKGVITNIRKVDDIEEGTTEDDLKIADFIFNGLYVFTSPAQRLNNGQSISFEYQTPGLLPANGNIFSIALYNAEINRRGKRIGYLSQSIPVFSDGVAPEWLSSSLPPNIEDIVFIQALSFINLSVFDSFGKIDENSFTGKLSGSLATGFSYNQDVTNKINKIKIGDGSSYNFIGDLNPLEDGVYSFEAAVKDFAKNSAAPNPYKVKFKIDRTKPTITINLPSSVLTNLSGIEVPVVINDLSSTLTTVYVNDVLSFSTALKQFTAVAVLGVEGNNVIKVVSTDAAGNIAVSDTKTVILDTTPPILSFISPKNSEAVDGFNFNVSCQSNEPVTQAMLNGNSFGFAGETTHFEKSYSVPQEGDTALTISATDKAGNVGTKTINVFAISRPLNQSLIGLYVDEPNNKVIVKGAVGATRPNYLVTVSRGFFSSQTIQAAADGSFMISMVPSTDYKVSVFDHKKNETVSFSYALGTDNNVILSGIIRDTDDFPLVNAKVSILNTQFTSNTDSNGVFTFSRTIFPNAKVTGDQVIVVDGSSVILSTEATPRKFSTVAVSITIGVNQSNILQTPIFLAPIYLDGSATSINAQSGGTVNDAHAQGVSLSIPANSAQFPNGQNVNLISVQTITAERATVLAPQWAKPKNVVALEPSGTIFSKSVELTLPNVNEFPPTSELVIMLMNSKTGRWEIGGAATVTADRQSIVTKPNQGIRHFSLAYATIAGPNVRPVGSQDKPGADTFNGALSTQIELPSFKSFGAKISPKLIYNSSWAKPAALVTNLFDFASTKVNVSSSVQVGVSLEPYTLDLVSCSWQILYEPDTNAFKDIANLPSYCTKDPKTFYSNVQYETKYTDVTSQIQPQRVEATLRTGNLITNKEIFSNIPHMATISFGVDLIKNNSTNEYFDSGIYPYQAHYDVFFKELVMGTFTTQYWSNTIDAKATDPKQFQQLSPEKVFGQDLIDSIYVQNYRNSEAGRGWKIGGYQKIVNPASDKVMIEEAEGGIATYSINNTIQTAIDVASQGGDIKNGVALNNWPNVAVPSSQNSNEILNLTFSSGSTSKSTIGTNYTVSGSIKGFDFYNFTTTTNCRSMRYCFKTDTYCELSVPNCGQGVTCFSIPGVSEIRTVCDNIPSSSCTQYSSNYEIKSKPISMLNLNGRVIGVDSDRHSVFEVFGGTTNQLLGAHEPMKTFSNNYGIASEVKGADINSFCSNTSGLSCSPQVRLHTELAQSNSCGTGPTSSGMSPYSQSDTILNGMQSLNTPMGIASSPTIDIVAIADYGFHKVRWLNVSTGETGVIAGNGQASDTGNGDLAFNASINHPKGLVYDSLGNLYISSESGYIRKVDTNGIISIVAGDPVNGILANETKATNAYFNKPYGLAFDQLKSHLYVADTGNNRVVRIDLNANTALTVAGNGRAGFSGDGQTALDASLNAPTQLGFDQNGNLLIADSGNNRIRRVIFQNASGGALAFSPTAKDNSMLQRVQDGTWVRTYRSGTRIYFSSSGYQVSAVDSIGRITRLHYDTQNRLTDIVMPDEGSLEYTYSGDKLSKIVDPAGRVTEFDYDYSGNLKSVHFPDQTSKRFEYNSDGLMTAEFDQKNSRRQYQYNLYSRLEKVTLSDLSEVALNDSGSANLENFNSEVTQPKKYGVDPAGLSENIFDANNNKTSVAKDFQGYISTVLDAKNRTTTTKRDIEGRAIEIIDVDGSVTQYAYDSAFGDLIQTKNLTADYTVETQYNVSGQVISKTDPNGKITTKEYGIKKELIKEIMPDGKYLFYEYNTSGLIMKKSAFNGANILQDEIRFEYNIKGQLVKQTDLNNKFSTYSYDLAGNTLTSTTNIGSNLQSTTTYEYDSMNRLTKIISPKGEETTYTYSEIGELLNIKDPNGKITSFEYDQRSQLVKKTDPAGIFHEMTYDKNGNLLTETDPANQTKVYSYNVMNKVVKVQTANDTILYNYNIKDEVISVANSTSTIDYQRDSKQRIVQEVVYGVNYPTHTVNFEYNKIDQRTALYSNFQNIAYSYNPLNYQLTSLQNNFGNIFNFGYDDANRLSFITRPGSRSDFSYDVGSALTRISHSASGNEKAFSEYQYDQRNFIIQKRNPASTLNYSYDSNGQLLSSSKAGAPTESETFSYDALGNRLTYNAAASIFDNSGQRIQDDGQYTYVYDSNGNIIYKSSKANGLSFAFEYTSLNQLKKATLTSSPLGGTVLKTVEYKYDPVGRRILRQAVDNIESGKSNLKKYYYDGDNILSELDAADNLTASYTHSPLKADDILSAKFTSYATPAYALSAGQELAANVGTVYYLKDHLNLVTEIINGSGDIVQRMDYSAFGVLRKVKDSLGNEVDFNQAPIKTTFSYTGREFESELSMYYYRARYYDPSTGRFLQRDPDPGKLANPRTFLNKYIYGANNPVMYSDPSGASFGDDFSRFVSGVVGVFFNILMISAVLADLWVGTIAHLINPSVFAQPKLHFESDGLTLENSFFTEILPNKQSASWGLVIFLNQKDEYGGEHWMHEYGHRLQYFEMGAIEYIGRGVGRLLNSGYAGFENDADERATRRFGRPVNIYAHLPL